MCFQNLNGAPGTQLPGASYPCKPAVRLAVKRLARLGPWAKATHLPPDAYLVMAAGAGAAARMRSRSP